ncbi:MAG: hypothetical protein KDK24_20315 [Pseudooceanicola sp.]|nr:hypothetical protein [Pseudooceanicola sp.]
MTKPVACPCCGTPDPEVDTNGFTACRVVWPAIDAACPMHAESVAMWNAKAARMLAARDDALVALRADRDALQARLDMLFEVLDAVETATATGDGLSPEATVEINLLMHSLIEGQMVVGYAHD